MAYQDTFSIKVDISPDILDTIKDVFADVLNNEEFKLVLNNTFAKMCDPYVPMDEGVLSQTLNITPEYIEYTQPYAHYQYIGQVYGPNIPITENGVIVGWFSRPGVPKQPTGRAINYSIDKHPLATSHWDEAMLRDKRDEFNEQVKNLIAEYARRQRNSG